MGIAPPSTAGLIIFDCDGVLVDSEPLSLRVMVETLSEFGIAIEEATVYGRFLGRSFASVVEIIKRDFGLALDKQTLEGARDRLYALFRKELQPIPGVTDVVAGLAAPFCVASSSQMERIRLSLELTGLASYFGDRIFSATMVAEGKPAPDLFLLAAHRMQVAPERCIVIEDSPAGIEAAKRAGMRVFAFTGGGHAQGSAHRLRLDALAPDAVFGEMARLPELIGATAFSDPMEPGRKRR